MVGGTRNVGVLGSDWLRMGDPSGQLGPAQLLDDVVPGPSQRLHVGGLATAGGQSEVVAQALLEL